MYSARGIRGRKYMPEKKDWRLDGGKCDGREDVREGEKNSSS